MHNQFTWIDLSTFNVEQAIKFYQKIFNWHCSDENADGYHICTAKNVHCVGLYAMPELFQKIKMPSFWMSYIAVTNIETVVDKAQKLGGKIELQEAGIWGKVALIRDPLGAGFTCYEGNVLQAKPDNEQHGRWCHNELFVSDIHVIKPFYENLFHWEIKYVADDRYLITDRDDHKIASIQVATNEEKGDKEFWAVFFTVDNLLATAETIKNLNGSIAYEYTNTEGKNLLAYDNQGAAFFLTEKNYRNNQPKQASAKEPSNYANTLKWKSFAGLFALYLVMLTEQNWGYGLFWLFWAIADITRGKTYFFDLLDRRTDATLYWAVISTWFLMAIYFLIYA